MLCLSWAGVVVISKTKCRFKLKHWLHTITSASCIITMVSMPGCEFPAVGSNPSENWVSPGWANGSFRSLGVLLLWLCFRWAEGDAKLRSQSIPGGECAASSTSAVKWPARPRLRLRWRGVPGRVGVWRQAVATVVGRSHPRPPPPLQDIVEKFCF